LPLLKFQPSYIYLTYHFWHFSWLESSSGPTPPCFQDFVMTLLGMDYMGLLFMPVASEFSSSF